MSASPCPQQAWLIAVKLNLIGYNCSDLYFDVIVIYFSLCGIKSGTSPVALA
ncbi:hypothetical protein VCHA29O37_520032 [Vibrio chagasii]|nr:hypothetical protein VCHA29O37_520032 [Vibrio chagasii]